MSREGPFIASALAGFLLLAMPAQAGGLTGEQRSRLEASVAAFHKATESHDAVAVVNFMPPAMIAKFAAAGNDTIEVVRKSLADKLDRLSEKLSKAEFVMDMGAATEGTAADGTAYAILPTKLHFELKDGTNVRTRAKTIAFEQGSQWYLLALTDDHIRQDFYDAYPQFKAVDIPLSRISQGN